ncbi:zf-HC2 domain-containing protein [Granulicoccus phenolivorans]|uniref:zf-HC2 domain-containing protein n=1 Tax=Granulicoccus phenolivorans TaxID=266854 RepID=UPI0004180667|nr:zf-HC2 domain-containing protein [Granulicoccus phenolivorans]
MTACRQNPHLSAFVDGAMNHTEREWMMRHLVRCADCRAEVAELRTVRHRLRSRARTSPVRPSDSLAGRLVGIAGDDAEQPLWSRPFDHPRSPAEDGTGRRLPRQRLRSRLQRGALVLVTLTVAVVAAGWFAAPPAATPAVDPIDQARGDFSAALTGNPLANPALNAALTIDEGDTYDEDAVTPGPAGDEALGSERAYAELSRADRARGTVRVTGVQKIQVRYGAGYRTSQVTVRARQSDGQVVQVHQLHGGSTRMLVPGHGTPSGVDLIARNFELQAFAGPKIAGRASTLVEARDGSGIAGRWWVDNQTGVLLWQVTYGPGGQVQESAGWSRLLIAGSEPATSTVSVAEPAQTLAQVDTHSMALAKAPELQAKGWVCETSLGGLELIRLRGQEAQGDPAIVSSVYGDGVRTVLVHQQQGALAGAPAGSTWDPHLGAYRQSGVPTVLTWQSGDRVYTVVTDGAEDLATQMVRELPHEAPVLRTRVDRVLDGWDRIRKAVVG